MTTIINAPYGPNTAIQNMNLYISNASSQFCFLMIHAGGIIDGDKISGPSYTNGMRLFNEGYNVAMINYRLPSPVYVAGKPYPQPNVVNTWPAPLADAQLAVRYLRSNYFPKIISWGDSAGATLSVLLACHNTIISEPYYPKESSKVNGAICHSTMADFVAVYKDNPPDNTNYVGPRTAFNSVVQAFYAQASAINNIASDTSPVAFSHGTQDTTIFYNQAIELQNALNAKRIPNYFQSYNAGHVFSGLSLAQRTKICKNAESWMLQRLGL